MQEAVASPLTGWANFYVIIGSAAAALTGLMFVVVTLIAGLRRRRSSGGINAFGTPNVVHFCVALLIAVTLNAPWHALWNAGLILGLCGIGGVAYIIIILRRALRQDDYTMVLEDWLWHMIIPFSSYSALVVAAILLSSHPVPALFCIGAVTILLLFTGIHNAWDALTYNAFDLHPGDSDQPLD
ncbi:hypothetical protein [Dictyobacter aurantiacus]|uniref:DUF2231 domain-containing protein n=1 Tax=Dictyobacter aurantiacus TaxID=1936993 RepID=A0A401ZSF0_9CHLR|nr:hypothetical protein [Dictyobacter aurantiacus]GCE09791.1 hypothetical protein KDAU_71200 [Dictyobacter aurantiacus]